MQLDQRGGTPGSMGCIDNLLIDKAILEDATKNSKNLSCTWHLDIRKKDHGNIISLVFVLVFQVILASLQNQGTIYLFIN